MAKEPEKKDAKEDEGEAAPAAPAPSTGGKAGMGPALAIGGVLAVGVGLGALGVSLLAGPSHPAEPGGHGATSSSGATAGHGGGKKGSGQGGEVNLLEDFKPLPLGEVVANVRNQNGRRFCKVSVEIWVGKDDFVKVGREEVKNILHQALEESLHSFDLEELSGDYIHTKLQTTFKDELDNQLRAVLGTQATGKTYVERVVLTGLLVQ